MTTPTHPRNHPPTHPPEAHMPALTIMTWATRDGAYACSREEVGQVAGAGVGEGMSCRRQNDEAAGGWRRRRGTEEGQGEP